MIAHFFLLVLHVPPKSNIFDFITVIICDTYANCEAPYYADFLTLVISSLLDPSIFSPNAFIKVWQLKILKLNLGSKTKSRLKSLPELYKIMTVQTLLNKS